VGVAAQELKALVSDLVLEVRQVEGQAKPQMVSAPARIILGNHLHALLF